MRRPIVMPFALDRLDQRRGHAGGRREAPRGSRWRPRSTPTPRATATAAARSASDGSSSPVTTRPIAARVRPLPCRSRIRRIRSAWSSPYQATRPSRAGCGSRPARLVEAHGVHRDVAGGRELFHPIPHDQTLYECALQPSHQALERRSRTDAPDYDAPREARSSRGQPRRGARLRVRDDGGRHRPEVPVRGRRLQRRPPVSAALLHRHRPAARDRAAGRRAASVLRSRAKPRRTTATSTRCSRCT